tara:strand:+ start:161 stop:694 length:534 start_codon:yes stop_codon:yes gene_type:complete
MTPFQRHLKHSLYIAEQAGGGDEGEYIEGDPPLYIYPDGQVLVWQDPPGEWIDIEDYNPDGDPEEEPEEEDDDGDIEDQQDEWEKERIRRISDSILQWLENDGEGGIDVLINPGDPDPLDPENDDYYDPFGDNRPFYDTEPHWEVERDLPSYPMKPNPQWSFPTPTETYPVWFGGEG